MKFSLVMLCLNEFECLKIILPRVDKTWVDEIIIVDGGSTDGSVEYARGQGFYVLSQKGEGIIQGYKEGFDQTTGDVIIDFTPDGNCIPEKIPELVEKMKEGYDMVIVSRYKDNAKSYDDTLISGLGNWLFTTLVNVLFKAQYTDVLNFFRACRRDVYQKAGIEIKRRPVQTRLSARLAKKGYKVAEISGDEPKRIAGKSYTHTVKNGLNELFIIIEEFFNIPSFFIDQLLKF
ncbi:MAG: glycosyltransferase family 2 protein [Candidatus Omnitrophica bacterium]|nr:glycosyltransferase family 2 protein [Candidatus Omnitrophota bacterium]